MNGAQKSSANPQSPTPPNQPQPLQPPQRPVYPTSPNEPPVDISAPSSSADNGNPITSDISLRTTVRSHPIPPPSNPRQNRAIGLLNGIYQHSEEQLTRGTLIAEDGTEIEAVLLGRVISLVKNHLDLSTSHLWVVYPRTRQKDECLHLQIVGVWEPETLGQSDEEDPEDDAAVETEDDSIKSGYFSVRGEVVFSNPEKAAVSVKIQQTAKKNEEEAKFFKVNLLGRLPDKALGHFWDLQVQLTGDKMMIQRGADLGRVSKKGLLRKGGVGKSGGASDRNAKRKYKDFDAPARVAKSEHQRPSPRKNPLPKPTPQKGSES